MLTQASARHKTGIGRCIGEIGQGQTGILENRTDQADTAGGTDSRYQTVRFHLEIPIVTIDPGEHLTGARRPQRIAIGEGLPQIFRQHARIIQAFNLREMLKIARFVLKKMSRISDFRVRIARPQVMDFQPFVLRQTTQPGQRSRHFSGNRYGHALQSGCDKIRQKYSC